MQPQIIQEKAVATQPLDYGFVTVEDISRSFIRRAKQDKDVVCAITAYEGEGKSTLAVNLAVTINRLRGMSEEELIEKFDDYMIYSPNKQEIKDKITKPDKYAPINSDEAIKSLYKLNWASESQKFLNMLYMLCRKENKINLMCIPRFTDLNEYFRNHRVMYWIFIVERGIGVLMQKDWNPFTRDPWHLIDNEKLVSIASKRKRIVDYSTEEKIGLLQKTMNFVAVVKFDDMESAYKKVYLAGKDKFSYGDMEQLEDGMGTMGKMAEKYRDAIIKVVSELKKNGNSIVGIAELTGISHDSISKYLKMNDEDKVIRYTEQPKRVIRLNEQLKRGIYTTINKTKEEN